jgi:hypothetical protein
MGAGGLVLRVIGDAAGEDHVVVEVRPVTGRIGGHRFELSVWPPSPRPSDPEAIRTESGHWVKLRLCGSYGVPVDGPAGGWPWDGIPAAPPSSLAAGAIEAGGVSIGIAAKT